MDAVASLQSALSSNLDPNLLCVSLDVDDDTKVFFPNLAKSCGDGPLKDEEIPIPSLIATRVASILRRQPNFSLQN